MRKRILYVHCESDLYGSNISLLNLCSNLNPREFEPFVLLARTGPLATVLKERSIKVFVRPMSYIRRSFDPLFFLKFAANYLPGIRAAANIITKHQIDLVHTNTIHIQAGAIAGRLLGKKVVWHIREIIPDPRIAIMPLYRLIHGLSDHIICISQAVRREMEKFVGRSGKISCIYNAVDTEKFVAQPDTQTTRHLLGIPVDSPLIGMVGRITFWKGQDAFIRAAALISKVFPQARFLIVGGIDRKRYHGYYQDLLNLAQTLGIRDKIVFTGFREDIPALMSAMDVVVVPSTRPEPFGLVVIEAMALKKPVIATDHGGAAEIIKSDELGSLVPPNNPEAIAERVEYFLNDDEIRTTIGENARKYVERNFTIKDYVENIQNVYRQLLA